MKFYYKCGTVSGQIIEEYIEANNISEARNILEEKGYIIFEIKKESEFLGILERRNEKKEIIAVTKMFGVLLKSGLEIVKIIDSVTEQIESKNLKKALREVLMDIKTGLTFSDSLRKHEKYFDSFYCSAVEAGERTGELETTFKRLYNYLKTKDNIRNKIRLAMIYPMFLAFFSIAVVLFLSLYVLPSFAKIYSSFGKSLPLITKVVMGISTGIRNYWYLIILAIGLGIYFGKKAIRNRDIMKKLDTFILKIPALKNFIYKKEIVNGFKTLSLSVGSGMDIIKSMNLAKESITNIKIKENFEKIVVEVSEGKKLSTAFNKYDFPKIAVQMINAGEESNNLEEMLDNASEYYEEELENAVEGMMGFMEPLLILIVGTLVGTIIIAMILPILMLSTAVS